MYMRMHPPGSLTKASVRGLGVGHMLSLVSESECSESLGMGWPLNTYLREVCVCVRGVCVGCVCRVWGGWVWGEEKFHHGGK